MIRWCCLALATHLSFPTSCHTLKSCPGPRREPTVQRPSLQPPSCPHTAAFRGPFLLDGFPHLSRRRTCVCQLLMFNHGLSIHVPITYLFAHYILKPLGVSFLNICPQILHPCSKRHSEKRVFTSLNDSPEHTLSWLFLLFNIFKLKERQK